MSEELKNTGAAGSAAPGQPANTQSAADAGREAADKGKDAKTTDIQKNPESANNSASDDSSGKNNQYGAENEGSSGGKTTDDGHKSGSNGGGGAKGVIKDGLAQDVDHESKGGYDTQLQNDTKGKSKGGKSKSTGSRIRNAFSKFMMMMKAAFTAMKVMLVAKLLMMLQMVLHAIVATVSAIASTIASAIMSVVTSVAVALGVSVAIASFGVLGLIGILAVGVAVVASSVVSSSIAEKDDSPPCIPVDMEYMEIPDGIPVEAWTNAKLIYTFFRTYGKACAEAAGNPDADITDEMIAGILGNWMLESKIDTTAVETVFNEPYAIGPMKRWMWEGRLSTRRIYNAKNEYLHTTLDPQYEKDESVGALGGPDDIIRISDDGDPIRYPNNGVHGPIKFNVRWMQDIYNVSYWQTYPKITRCGIGLGQWTDVDRPVLARNPDGSVVYGPYPENPQGRCSRLLDYADEKGRDWYDLDLQLMYALTESDFFETWFVDRGLTSYTINGHVYENGLVHDGKVVKKAASVAKATESFYRDWEGGGDTSLEARIDYAFTWYLIITEWKEGRDYVLDTGSSLWASLESIGDIASDRNQSDSARSCNELTFMGNSSLAEAMVSYAWAPNKDDHNDGTTCWKHLHSTLAPGDTYLRSCDRTVAIGVWWSGTDSSYPLGSTQTQLQYLLEKDAQYRAALARGGASALSNDTAWWMKVETEWNGNVEDYKAQLRPGDVLIRNDAIAVPPGYGSAGVGHTLCYVGEDTVRRRWGNDQSVPEEFLEGYCIVSGSINSRSPGTDKFLTASNGSSALQSYFVFRNVKSYCADDARTKVAVTCAGHSNDQ